MNTRLLRLRGLYPIADVSVWPEDGGDQLLTRTRAVLSAGPCCLQLRAKTLADHQIRELAREFSGACREAGVPFCLNDRADLAVVVNADVVHVGQDDLPIAAVRKVLQSAGRTLTVGVSTHNLEQARVAVAGGADYIGFGPVFDTRSKENPDPTVGVVGLTGVVREVDVPVVAIGGITVDNVREVIEAGADAAAVISAVWGAPDPAAAAADFVARLAG